LNKKKFIVLAGVLIFLNLFNILSYADVIPIGEFHHAPLNEKVEEYFNYMDEVTKERYRSDYDEFVFYKYIKIPLKELLLILTVILIIFGTTLLAIKITTKDVKVKNYLKKVFTIFIIFFNLILFYTVDVTESFYIDACSTISYNGFWGKMFFLLYVFLIVRIFLKYRKESDKENKKLNKILLITCIFLVLIVIRCVLLVGAAEIGYYDDSNFNLFY